jgi:hypothetical protein
MKTNKKARRIKLAAFVALMGLSFSGSAAENAGSHKAIKPIFRKTTPLTKRNKAKSTTYTFNASSDRNNFTQFTVSVNGAQVGGLYQIDSYNASVAVVDSNPVSSGATVVVQILQGTVPGSSWLIGPFTVQGTISNRTITFTNVSLSTGGSCNLLFNSN